MSSVGEEDFYGKDKFSKLKREIEEKRKMFFDNDPLFGDFPNHVNNHHRGASPGPNGSPRMGRAGFPGFDSARSRFEDFPAAGGVRHPMFSTMRRPAWEDEAFGGHPFNRERHSSGGSSGGGGGSASTASGEEHIIPIRIERSDGTTTTNAHAKAQAKANASANSNPISTTPIPMGPSPGSLPQQTSNHIQVPGPQRSSTNTTSPPSPTAGDRRSPLRASSAPPETSSDKTFVSNIKVEPKVPQTQFGGNCTKEKTPPKGAANGEGRPIPIFVEGRGPVMANNVHHEQHQRSAVPPTNANTTHQQQQPKASRPAEPREVTPPPKKVAPPKDPLEKVKDITGDVKELEEKVDKFTGSSGRDKEYIYLDEMLTRNLIKLDVIETEGREDVRNARKDCIKLIQSCISKLESKVPLKSSEQSMEVDASASQSTETGAAGVPDANAAAAAGDSATATAPPSESVALENTPPVNPTAAAADGSGDAVKVST